MDLSLPVVDGWEATRRVKSNPITAKIPIIALTAHAMAEIRGKALSAGCHDFDTKPIEIPRLISKINGLLHRRTSNFFVGQASLDRVGVLPPGSAAQIALRPRLPLAIEVGTNAATGVRGRIRKLMAIERYK